MTCSRRDFFRRGLVEAISSAAKEARGLAAASPILVDPERCYSAMSCPCEICVERCPRDPAPIRVELGSPPLVGPGCDGCGDCVYFCPADALESVAGSTE